DSWVLREVMVLATLAIALYFAVTEGVWGYTPGKWCVRLRVWRGGSSNPPGVPRALLRFLVFWLLAAAPPAGILFAFDIHQSMGVFPRYALWSVVQMVCQLLGLGLMLSPMRQRNGYRCLHDLLSGTRVVSLPAPEKSWSLPGRRLEPVTAAVDGLPQRLGGFTVRGLRGEPARGRVRLAEEPTRDGQVILGLHPPGEAAPGQARRDLDRVARLRWLAGGQDNGHPWDALLAPAGCS